METAEDYRDTLRHLFDALRREQGVTISQIAKQSGMSQQILAGVLRKERNLSTQSLARFLNRLGYAIHFELIVPATEVENTTYRAFSPSVPNRRRSNPS
jgi:transcriptional regulator with XRE-family HTH domain